MSDQGRKPGASILEFRTAGRSDGNDLAVGVGINQCGQIDDSIVFWHDNRGAWILAFSDLETIYFAAKRERAL